MGSRVFFPATKREEQRFLGAYPTAEEMAAGARDTGFFLLRGDADHLNFPQQHASLLPRPLSDSRENMRYAAQRVSRNLTPQIIPPQLRQVLESSFVISAPTSAPTVSPPTGIRYFRTAPTSAPTVSTPTGPITSRAQQQQERILDDNENTRNNPQIEHGQPQTGTSTTAGRPIWSSSLTREKYSAANIIQAAAIRTSNQNFMEVLMRSLYGVEEDDAMDDGVLIEYPLKHSPECVLLRPVPGVDIHPDYIWKNWDACVRQ